MYSSKQNVNILTSLILGYGIRHAVVCPGSRNGAIVHNLHQLSLEPEVDFNIHSITDERSAGFFAIGLSLANGLEPVIVCVTSGSALLGTLPAVAEAYYRHIPLIIVSADRPGRWIGQLDGQTLPQIGALEPYTHTFNIPEFSSSDEDAAWHTRTIISRALVNSRFCGGGPIHINVPLTEPLFDFSIPELPRIEPIHAVREEAEQPLPAYIARCIQQAKFPLLVIGQTDTCDLAPFAVLSEKAQLLIASEIISNISDDGLMTLLESHPELLDSLKPDVVIHIGGNLIGKTLKNHLRKLRGLKVVRIDDSQEMPDTFSALFAFVQSNPLSALKQLSDALTPSAEILKFKQRVKALQNDALPVRSEQDMLLHCLRAHLEENSALLKSATLHVANSSILRSANRSLQSLGIPCFANRGVNGIEGSMSVAAGYALESKGLNLLLIGDLSFFYDINALWNRQLPPNLRILLVNNGGGKIFESLPGLSSSPAREDYVAASHHTSAENVCLTYNLNYYHAETIEQAAASFSSWLDPESDRASLLEYACF